jgi:hypothetical protein
LLSKQDMSYGIWLVIRHEKPEALLSAVTLAFQWYGNNGGRKRRLVAQAILGWNQILHSLQRIDLLRREGFFRAA